HHLQGLGVGPEVRVGLCLERSAEMVVATLGILRAGGVYLPLDPAHPPERTRFMLADSGAAVVVTRSELAARVAGHGAELVLLDAAADAIASAPGTPPVSGADPLNAAYVIYTSGSTGTPKGVMVSHRSLVCYAEAARKDLGLGAEDRFLQFASPAFDVMVEEIFPAWLSGAAVVFPEHDLLESPEALLEVVEAQGVTGFELPTAFWHEWVRMLAEEGRRLPASLRFVIVGGERVLPERLAQWAELDVPLVHVFGLTETTVSSAMLRLEAGDDGSRWSSLPVGHPLDNAALYVLDGGMQPVPEGAPGELYLGGDTVARGYSGQPALTAGRFVPDPFGRPGSRLYRTGDRVRRLDEGGFEFLGRIDQQVKVRGFRIEPAEVEAALATHPAVRETVVVAREEAQGRKQLLAYVVPAQGGSVLPVPADELRAHVAGRLPEYMVPGAFVAIDHIPLTSNGKIDRRALPGPEAGPAATSAAYAAPSSEVERTLCAILAEALRLKRVGVHDNFFELGGDSIVAIQIVSRARRAGLWLKPRQLFLHPTVARLAREVGAVEGAGVQAEQGAVTGEVELTPIQRWFFAEEIAERHHWNMPLLLELRSPLDPAVLETALQRVVAHHDALRSRYAQMADGAWVQTCAAPGDPVPFERVDLSGVVDAKLAEAMERRSAEAQTRLDLGRGPLLRAVLFAAGEGRAWRLLLAVHHLVVDGVSWRILLEDLATACEQLARGEAVSLPAKTTSFQRWARRLAEHTASGGFDAELDHWLDEPHRTVRPLPVDGDRGGNTSGASRTVSVSLSAEETRALLQDVPAAYRTQVGDALLTGLARAFGSWTGETRLLVDLEGHGREEMFDDVDLSRTVGWFTTAYPVLLDLRGAGTDGESLKRVKEQLRGIPGQGIGFGALRWLSGDAAVRERLAALPPAEVAFNHLGQADASLPEEGLFRLAADAAGEGMSPRAPRQHLLAINSIVLDRRLRVDWTYGEATHRRETVEALAERHLAELRALVAHCGSAEAGGYTPSDFPLADLSQEELDRLLAGDRGVEDVYPLSSLQEGLLFHTMLSREEGFYHAHYGFELEGALDAEALRRAWDATLARHSALRASFRWKDLSRPLQVVHLEIHLPFAQEDWRALPPAEQEAALETYLRDDLARGFDLESAPLMRVALFQTGDERFRMVWSLLQAVLDGWSMPLVFRDLRAFYQAFVEGQPPALGAAPRHREYIAWAARQDPSRTEGFWREALAGFDTPTPLPLEHAAAAPGPERREQAALQLPAVGTDALRAFARVRGLTPGTLVQGAWALLLARCAGEDDVVFGVTVSGRPAELAGVEEMVGVFINTLPVRVRLPEDARVSEWLGVLQADAAAVREHEHVPLTQVQQWSGVPAGQELFESIYVFENYPMGEALAGGIGGVTVRATTAVERGNYPLTLVVLPGASLTLRLLFDPDRLEPAAAGRLLGHLSTVVEAMAAHPERRLRQVPLLREAERTQLLEEWNATAAAYPHACLHDLLAGQAARTPREVAVVFGGDSLTYAELDRRADRLARHLRHQGVGPESRVGVCAERSLELVVALLAVLRAGGAYVPVDPGHPAERITYMLADSAVQVLLAQERFVDALPVHGAELVVLDRSGKWTGAGSPEAPASAAVPENAAYVIYTSGSTGRPKGAVNEHRGIVNRLLWMQERYRLDASDVVLQKTPFGFDVSVWELFWPLLAGARLVVAEPGGHRDPTYLAELIERERVTTAHFVPPMLQAFLEGADPERCRSLRRVVCSGEALPAELTERFFAALPWAELHNLYGPTEAAVDVTHHACVRTPGRVVPIGRPVANTRVYVLDGRLEPAPMGVAGELYIGGVQVGRGYLGRPELTAERFVPDPFGEPGARLYRTGDRTRWLASGEVEYLGRTDFQVKIRGFRVEPGEVEAALLAHAPVREALMMLREDAPGQRQLVAYVVPTDAAELSAPELRARLETVLPEHMVPAAFVVLERMPLTSNGKVDRAALPKPEQGGVPGRVAPRTATEEVLAGIWADVLGVEQVWANDSFFELGGHSLLVTRVVSRVRQALGVEVPLRAVFDARTVSALARRIDELQSDGRPAAPPVRRVPRDGPLPVSFAQQRLWVMDRLEPGSPAYNMPFALRLRGDLDVPALRASLDEVVRRHEVLRTVFAEHQGVPVQVVLPAGRRALPAVDLRGLPGGEAEALRLAREEAVRPFDLARGPMLRSTLLRIGDREHVLCVTMHHVVSDGWSLDVLTGEVSALYATFGRGEPSPLAELPVQYADYTVWQRGWLTDDVLDRQLAYWRERLSDAPPLLEFPVDRARSVGQSARAGIWRFALPAATTRDLRSLARREGATLFMTVLAAWQALLGRYAGQDDVVVGSPVAGRTRLETEGLIGMFVNLLPLRADLGGEPTWRELLERVRSDALGAYSHQDLPFERLVDEIATERSLTYFPVFQVVFALQRAGRDPVSLGDIAVQPFGGDAAGVRVDLELTLEERDKGLSGELLYREALFDPASIERLMQHLGACLEAVAADPAGRFSELSLLRGAERVQVLETWNATASEPPRALVHELFSEQAALTPDVPAATDGADSMTYAELERRSSQLAHHLRRRGAGPEVRVGICLERGLDLVVGVLGVLRAGGVYVPLDPTFPAERLAYMLADSGAPLLLSRAALLDRLPGFGGEVVCLDRDAAAIATEPELALPVRLDACNAAYVIYTSGSTGTPKGVVVEHGSMANFVVAMQRLYDYREGEAVLGVGSFAFDVWIFETFVPLVCGATARVLPAERVRDGAALVEELRTAGRMAAVPAIFRQAIQAARQVEPGALVGVRYVFAGGEAVPPEMWAEMREVFPGARLFVGYGPTEATVLATMFAVPEGQHGGGPVIGRPLPNARTYVLDARGDALPVGVPGELYLGGTGVARGYLGRPELTAERFVPDPFGGELGSRLYRTGDRVRWRADEELEYLGRLDTQVKIRGFRIELGEVESALAAHPQVREALALVREDVPGRRVLTAYVVPEEGEEIAAAELRERLAAGLPEYMVPGAYVVLERFPLSAVGKVDRRALPAPSRGAVEEGYVAPRTPLEEVLSGIWAEVLGMESFGVEESFFALGGDSILSIQVISRARRRGLALTARQLFENPTVAGLARVVESAGAEPAAAQETDAASSAFPLSGLDREALDSLVGGDGEVEDVYPLTPMQEGMLFHTLYAPGSGIYVRQSVFVLEGPLDDWALERAWQGVVARHEALRAGFAWEGVHRPVQRIHREPGVPFGRTDWRGLAPADVQARLETYLTEDRVRGFDPACAPLMRLELFCLAREEHRLLWTTHHVIVDGWSLSLIFRDVLALYTVYARGEATPRLEPAGRYRDYVAWLERQDRSRAESYWRAALVGFDAPTRLRLPKAAGHDGGDGITGSAKAVFDEAAMRPLRELAARRGVTMNTLVQGAWALLLSRYAGEDDVVFGAAVSGRPAELPGVEATVGLFINSLPVRARVDSTAPAGEWLEAFQERQVRAREYEYSPLVEVKKWSGVPDGEPLFETLVAFDNFPVVRASGEAAGGLRVRGAAGMDQTDYPLSLVAHAAATLTLDLRYDRGLVEAETAERMAGHLQAALEAMAASPERPLAAVSLLREAERAQVVEAWNATAAAFPRACVHDLFAEWAARTPDAHAVTIADQVLTCAELQSSANRLAHRLRRLGVGPEARVGICLERSAEMVVAILAVLRAGGAYVPLDPAYPPERLRHMLADSGAAAVLTRTELAAAVDGYAGALVLLDAEREAVAAEPDRAPGSGVSPQNAAYVIYTSGSTGTPKGVVVPHLGLCNVALAQARVLGITPGDRVLQFASASFDASVFEMVMALACGGTLCVGTREELAPGPDLLRFLRGRGITAATLPPSALAVLPQAELPALRVLMTAGEALPAEMVERWAPGRALFNLYGPTEGSIWSTAARCREGAGRPPIGRPIPNTAAYVLDAALQPAPVGVPGELYVGGAGVARGYLGRPDLTAERFVPDALSGEAGARLYRTGDQVRWLAAGELEYLGRSDEQVKVRGFRIELGEVEAALRGHPEVREAVVVMREDAPGDRRLVGYAVAEAAADFPAGWLRSWLKERLPEHMVPSAVVLLDGMPLTPSGKVDRRALPSPESGGGVGYVAPWTPVEEMLSGIWAEVLRLKKVGGEDGFFELGGHSLLAIQVVSRIREVLGVEIPLQVFFEVPTVVELAERIEALRAAGKGVVQEPIRRAPRDGPLPLSFGQQRLWLLDRLEPGSPAYNIPAALRLRGRLDVAALRGSLDVLSRRHEVLRTVFAEREGAPVQVVHPPAPVPLPVLDLRAHPAPEEEALRLAGEEALRPFDLARGPLLRSTLLRLGDEDSVLLFTLHHAASDGWSTDVLTREVSEAYAALSRGGEPSLPELPVQYADFAVWQRSWLSGEVLEGQLAYWRERLAGAPLLEIPTDRPRSPEADARAESHAFVLSGEASERLRTLSRREGTTLFMTALAAWQMVLGRWAGQDDVVVGTPIAGRTTRETEGLIGFFVNMLALRADLAEDPTWTGLLGRVREAALGAYAHQELPFERLVEELGGERSLTHSPVFQATFALDRSGAGRGLSLGGLAVEPFGAGQGVAKFDLDLSLGETGAGLGGALLYRTALFDPGTMARMAGHVELALESLGADPSWRIGDVPLLRGAERAQVLEAWNDTAADFPRACIHELFAAQAARTPTGVALSWEGESLGYAELDARSNRLAHHLRALGVGPEVRVGISLERGPEQIAAVLAILKAGGCYVPLDPGYPVERLELMARDSAVRVLVARGPAVGWTPDGTAVVRLDEDRAEIEARPVTEPGVAVDPRGLAYVSYTSGSTGVPKGVQVPHHAVVRLVRGADYLELGSGETFLGLAPLSFDASTLELWGALLNGMRLALYPPEPVAARTLGAFLREQGVTTAWLTAGLFHAVVDEDVEALGGLRQLVAGGEALSVPHCRRVLRAHPRLRLVNGYGPTENTTFTCCHHVRPADVERTSIPLGRPIANTRAYVLDARGGPCPVGVAGELYAAGAGVARGYLGRPELTAERFVPDPFGGEGGGRLYRTGDRVRWLATGELEYLGRMDQQLKVRGFRIEPGEIEAALGSHPAVREAVVVLREDVPGVRRLVAYGVVEEGAELSVGELRAHLSARLPEYMIPAAYVVLPALPLSANGKVDRWALPVPERVEETEYLAPRTVVEELLCSIWAELLGVERVGVNDDFFALGGHSLLATRMAFRAMQSFGVEVPLRTLFEMPTVAALAVALEDRMLLGLDDAEVAAGLM
ncbi:MAG: non-ribosomal peptide synthase/polyketide synthase, partial [Longimicrobiaceae bacterium]